MVEVIDIRGAGVKIKQQSPARKSLMEKLQEYERRHSLQRLGGNKKDGKPKDFFTSEPIKIPERVVKRFNPVKKGNGKTEWEVIIAHYSKTYPFRTQKLRFDYEPSILKAAQEAERIRKLLVKCGGYDDKDLIIVGLGMTGIIESHKDIKPKTIKKREG